MPALLQTCLQHLRRLRLRADGLALAADVRLAAGLVLRPGYRDSRPGSIAVGARSQLETGVVLDAWGGSIVVGENVFFGPHSVVYGQGGVEIGDGCLVAMHCRILSSEHSIPPSGRPIRGEPDLLKPTRLGRDVWLGAGVTVLGGVTLGDGCIVGAGAVVTRDLPPGSIAVGVPARVTGQRPAA